jgi:hypothetical protein
MHRCTTLFRRAVATLAVATGILLTGVSAANAFTCQNRSFHLGSVAGVPTYFVSAEVGYASSTSGYGMLRARSTTVGGWEHFRMVCQPGGTFGIIGPNGLWVSTELQYPSFSTNVLRSRGTWFGPWEKFTFASTYEDRWVARGALRSVAANRYVSAERDYTSIRFGMLRARSSVAGQWEQFVIWWD